jgi:hypothetical protein
MYLQRNRELKEYSEMVKENEDELEVLKSIFRENSLNFVDQKNSIRFSGNIALDKLSEILNYLAVTKQLKVNSLNLKSQAELPLLIGEQIAPEMHINIMEIEQIEINEQVLGG